MTLCCDMTAASLAPRLIVLSQLGLPGSVVMTLSSGSSLQKIALFAVAIKAAYSEALQHSSLSFWDAGHP